MEKILLLLLLLFGMNTASAFTIKAVTEELPPYNYRDDTGLATGFSVEVLQNMLAISGIELEKDEISIMPWARAYRSALQEPNTVLFSTIRLPERESLFHWIGPIGGRDLWYYRLVDRKDVAAQNVSELSRWRIAVVRDSAAAKELTALGLNIILVNHEIDKFRMLLRHRADIAPAMAMGAAYHMNKLGHNYNMLEPLFLSDNTKYFYFALNKGTDITIVEKLNAALASMHEDGTYEGLKNKWWKRLSTSSRLHIGNGT